MILNEIVRSSSSKLPCEDVFGFRYGKSGLSLWVIDGATSIAPEPRQFHRGMTDSAWFARTISEGFFAATERYPLHQGTVAAIIRDARTRYLARCAHVPLHDHPLAAATYAHISHSRGLTTVIDTIEWADCFLHMSPLPPSLFSPHPRVPSIFPEIVVNGPLKLVGAALEIARRRREQQILTGDGKALTLEPRSAFNAKTSRLVARGPTLLMIGSDGFERLWRGYKARPWTRIFRSAAAGNLIAEMSFLRAWEAANADKIGEAKRFDDATAMVSIVGLNPRSAIPSLFQAKRSATIRFSRLS